MFELVRRNRRRSALFAAAMLALVAASGWAAGVLTLGPDLGWIGIAAGFVQLIRQLMRDTKDDRS